MSDDPLRHFPDPAAHRGRLLALLETSALPVFVAERRLLADRYGAMARALTARWPAWTIAYSFKTNYQVAEAGALRPLGAIAEVVSGHEYRLAKRLGFPGAEIVFNGPYKTDDELRTALDDGARINVNDPDELGRIEAVARASGRCCAIGLRVNVPVSAFPPSRFGFAVADGEADAAARRVWASPHLRLAGLHLHLRGDIDDPAWYREAGRALTGFLRAWPAERRAALEYLDMGSGFPSHMSKLDTRAEWNPQPIETYVEAISDELRPAFEGLTPPRLIVEPGRYLVNDAILFVSRIVSVRDRAGIQQVVCNAATTMLPFTRHRAPILRAFRADLTRPAGEAVASALHGASCREDDVLYQGPLPRVAPGDLVVHFGVGAYNASLNPEFIFERPPLRFIEPEPPGG